MSKASSRDRLMKLEKQRRFLDWFVWNRFYESLTADELATFARDGHLPNPLPNRPSGVDGSDRKTLLKRWEDSERVFGGRSREELEYYADNGSWPEQTGRLHYSMQDGKLVVEWRNEPEGDNPASGTSTQEQGTR
jgi:hypothetical protein